MANTNSKLISCQKRKGKALNSFRKPWLTKSLLRSINKKNKLYKQYLHHQSNEKLLKYKTYKNKLTNLLRVAKRLYFENQIEINKKTPEGVYAG